MRIPEVRELSFITFFPASRKSDFFYMRLSVGSVVFVSYMQESVGFSLCKFLWKIRSSETQQEDFCIKPLGLELSKRLRSRKYFCI